MARVATPVAVIAPEQPGQTWLVRPPPDEVKVRELVSVVKHPLIARLLLNRGVETPEAAREFLDPDLRKLHDPFLFAGMNEAVERIHDALKKRQRTAVYGDYDVDGVASTACLVSFLRACGGDVRPYIPNRLKEGYGVNIGAIEKLAREGIDLIITCDCGIGAAREIARAAELGVDVIVVDHHRVPNRRPEAIAILDPHREDCNYPYEDLAAVGVAFKLLMALRKRLREAGWFPRLRRPEPNLRDLLDLVALGTVADVVPLTGENRVLVAHGLKVLGEGKRLGLRALKAVAGIDGGAVTAGQVAFKLAPRINAAGRLDDARAGLDLILCEDPFHASRLASALDLANVERQRLEAEVVKEALAQARARPLDERGLVLCGDGWHRGVIGIVASRVVERFNRPTIVLGREGDSLQGSGRTAGRFHLHQALEACALHLESFGGHRAAAGLRLPADRLDAFRQAFLSQCLERVKEQDMVPVLVADAELKLRTVDEGLAEGVEELAPFGAGNPTPVFIARGARLEACRLVGRAGLDGERHLKARVDGMDTVAFAQGSAAALEGGRVDLVFSVGFNSWAGRRSLQIGTRALLPEGEAAITVGRDPRGTGLL